GAPAASRGAKTVITANGSLGTGEVPSEPSALEFGRDRSVAPDEPQYVLAVLVDDDDGARITHRRLVPRFTVGERNAASRHVHARWVETERTVVLDDGLSPDRRTASQRVVPTVPRAGEHLEIRDRLLRLSARAGV